MKNIAEDKTSPINKIVLLTQATVDREKLDISVRKIFVLKLANTRLSNVDVRKFIILKIQK